MWTVRPEVCACFTLIFNTKNLVENVFYFIMIIIINIIIIIFNYLYLIYIQFC